ncbi:hypothetical protein N7461_004920 [Penicillium sp. DV-2018c]|nr:hypothetical protein N7461_004920 [Penicillium sp. DV-2018c]
MSGRVKESLPQWDCKPVSKRPPGASAPRKTSRATWRITHITSIPDGYVHKPHKPRKKEASNPSIQQIDYRWEHGGFQQNSQEPPWSRMLDFVSRQYECDPEDKYGGGLYDNFEGKLRLFYHICGSAGLQEHQFGMAFRLMLTGKARAFYISKICGIVKDFPTMVELVRDRFGLQNYVSSFMIWNETTFRSVIAQNPDKSRSECLEILFDTLEGIQPGLPSQYQSEDKLREQIIRACGGAEELGYKPKPTSTLEMVQTELRLDIAISEGYGHV